MTALRYGILALSVVGTLVIGGIPRAILAGIVTGLANENWLATLIATAIWPFIWVAVCCFLVGPDMSVRMRVPADLTDETLQVLAENGVITRPSMSWFYGREFGRALFISGFFALVAHALRPLL